MNVFFRNDRRFRLSKIGPFFKFELLLLAIQFFFGWTIPVRSQRINLSSFRVRFPGGFHFLQSIRLITREIVQLSTISFQIIKFPRAIFAGSNQLPFALTNRTIPFMLPEKGSALDGLSSECRRQTATLRRLNGDPIHFVGVVRLGHINARGHDVDQVTGLVFKLALSSDLLWPVGDQWC